MVITYIVMLRKQNIALCYSVGAALNESCVILVEFDLRDSAFSPLNCI